MSNRRIWMACRLGLSPIFVAVLWLGADLSAQNPSKKGAREEVEDKAKPKTKEVLRVGDEEPDAKTSRKTTAPDTINLTTAARQAKHPAVRKLFQSLAVPHDDVTWRSTGRTYPVEPIPEYIGTKLNSSSVLKMRLLDSEGRPEKETTPARDQLARIEVYEELAQSKVEEFLTRSGLDALPRNSEQYLSRQGMLVAAETALGAVLRFHESARDRGRRRGDGWDRIEASLREKLLDVQFKQLHGLGEANDWSNAWELARRLARAYPKEAEQFKIAEVLVTIVKGSLPSGELDEKQVQEVQQRLKALDGLFPNSSAGQPIHNFLRRHAEELVTRARSLEKTQPKEALELLRRAEDVYPGLPALHEDRLRLSNVHPVLQVGVRELPVNLSPGLAYTDSERQAVEMLFESLLKVTYDPVSGQRYVPGLAAGLPVPMAPLGRQFQLARDATWSNGKPVTAADVANTVRLLKKPNMTRYTPAWADLVEDARAGGDPYRVNVSLRQGILDPLELLTFKILPQQPYDNHTLAGIDDLKLASNPAGSGPYLYKGKATSRGRQVAMFVANPQYGSRASKAGLPHIHEVHFFHSEDAIKDFKEGKLDLLLDLSADRVKALQAGVSGLQILPPLPNRRVYFLAVNHRNPNLRNQALRRALAFAIQREMILDKHFRAEPGQKVHRPLNGPFPPDSWACDPKLPSLDRPEAKNPARTLIKEAERAGLSSKKLSLKYPKDDPVLDRAMQTLRDQVKKEIGVELDLKPLDPHELHRDVEQTHAYELAYYHYDYPSEAYWLWPLFDPQGVEMGHGNFLGYRNDSNLESLFRQALGHCEFGEVQRLTHLIQGVLQSEMPLIPLWQLDTFVALNPEVQTVPFDPLLVFSDMEQWSIRKK